MRFGSVVFSIRNSIIGMRSKTSQVSSWRLDLSLCGQAQSRAPCPQCRAAQGVRAIAWKAQLRLCGRCRVSPPAAKPKVVVTTVVARGMVGFVWAIACRVQPQPAA